MGTNLTTKLKMEFNKFSEAFRKLIDEYGLSPEKLNGEKPFLTGSQYFEIKNRAYGICLRYRIGIENADGPIRYVENILGIEN